VATKDTEERVMTGHSFETYKQNFERDGFVVMQNALTQQQVRDMNAQLRAWVDESRGHEKAYGRIADGRPRFDVEPSSHCSETPALRRISAPIEVSDIYLDVMRNNAALDLTAHIFSPNIKLHATKINLKLPGSGTAVKYHQDFPFEPHSNDDVMTVLFFLDDVTLENGPLEVVPGSHKGAIHSLWQDGTFTGAVDADVEAGSRAGALKCTGKAGDACLMHSRLLHGSLPNMTDAARCLYIVTYVAEDAIALDRNPIPHEYDGEVVRGTYTGRVRSTSFEMEMPEYPKEASFFGQQSKVG
jgi:phytanoyl-CoA hydroxylase